MQSIETNDEILKRRGDQKPEVSGLRLCILDSLCTWGDGRVEKTAQFCHRDTQMFLSLLCQKNSDISYIERCP